jgi:coproporphyrinogen III oxidase
VPDENKRTLLKKMDESGQRNGAEHWSVLGDFGSKMVYMRKIEGAKFYSIFGQLCGPIEFDLYPLHMLCSLYFFLTHTSEICVVYGAQFCSFGKQFQPIP